MVAMASQSQVDQVLAGLKRQLFIDGEWVDAIQGSRFSVMDPSTGRQLIEVAEAQAADVDAAVAAARRAYEELSLIHN
jgi:acyl-CoA reductase-like NAD-dependent aldehyde dehydrogenase